MGEMETNGDEAATERRARLKAKDASERARKATDALNAIAQLGFAEAAADFLRRGLRVSSHPKMAAFIADGLLQPFVFSQKSPAHMRFYQRLFFAPVEVRSVLEIGVKDGGSLAAWQSAFPAAKIVGLDKSLARAVRHEGIVYLEGDQADTELLDAIAIQHGPFDVVIDDGSHVGKDQLASLTALAPHVRPGGAYIVEDTHAAVKPTGERYGEDLWTHFVSFLFERLRDNWPPPREMTPLSQQAQEIAHQLLPRVADLLISHQLLALRMKDEGTVP